MRSRWGVLAAGTLAQASTAAHFLGLAAVTPALREHFGLDLAGVGALIGVVSVGIMTTLIPWGGAADRFGERWVMVAGLAGAAALLSATGLVRDATTAGLLLFLAGASGAAVNAASGRAVLTWFPGRQRGLAMAVRQTAVPLGAGLAALTLPAIATRGGLPAVFCALGGLCAVAAVTAGLVVREPAPRGAAATVDVTRPLVRDAETDPDGPRAAASRVRTGRTTGLRAVLTDRRLLLLSLAGALLVVPQFVGSVLLVEVLLASGLSVGAAGVLLALTQALGAAGRLVNGWWSDRVGSRLGPLRIVAIATAAGFGLAAALQPGPGPLLAAVLVPAAALAISWNGLVFTAAGELAPPGRTATAMAVSNTANYGSAAATPAVGGLIAQLAGWPAGLALGAVAAGGAVAAVHRLADPARRVGHTAGATSHRSGSARYGVSRTR